MREITKEYAKEHNLKRLARAENSDMSKLILLMERLKENKQIKYYSMDLIIFNTINQTGNIEISFWADN